MAPDSESKEHNSLDHNRHLCELFVGEEQLSMNDCSTLKLPNGQHVKDYLKSSFPRRPGESNLDIRTKLSGFCPPAGCTDC
jgi:hypothetical protein